MHLKHEIRIYQYDLKDITRNQEQTTLVSEAAIAPIDADLRARHELRGVATEVYDGTLRVERFVSTSTAMRIKEKE